MARNYIQTLFNDAMRDLQAQDGSRSAYARMEEGANGQPDVLTEREHAFIAARDSFYIATITEHGWPYVQHRGGPQGFLAALEGNRLGMADYRGNRQHVSTANIAASSRASLFLMDYPNKRRLKLLANASVVRAEEDSALVSRLMPAGYKALPERAYIFDVVGFDWNCPAHITPRFTQEEIAQLLQPLVDERDRLRTEIAALKQQIGRGRG